MIHDLNALLRPRSIAVIGASTQLDKVGGAPLRMLRELGYAGDIIPVHRSAVEVQGLPAVPSLDQINSPVDLAIVALPVNALDDVLAQLERNRTRAAVVFTSGFAEMGAAGVAQQRALAEFASRTGMVLLGPNCLGAMNLRERVFATFSQLPLSGLPPLGDVGLVSQSGAFGGYAFALAREAGLGLSHWVTTGNEAGLQAADVIHWMTQDPDTRVILAYIEGCRDGDRLCRALAAARDAGKPVVITKVGTTAAGANAAQSHTASLAGEDAVYQAVFDEYGVHRAHTLEEFFRLGYVLSRGARPPRWSSPSGRAIDAVAPVALVTISGGVGILMADRAEQLSLSLPALPDLPAKKLLEKVPFASTANPIDVTGQIVAIPEVLRDAFIAAAESGEYGAVIAFLAGGANVPLVWNVVQQAVEHLHERGNNTPLIISGLLDKERRTWLETYGGLAFREPAHAVEAVATLARAAAQEQLHAAQVATQKLPADLPLPGPSVRSLSEFEASALLERAGVPVAMGGLARDADEAMRIADRLGYPVTVKLCSPDILHKSDVGGVLLNLLDAQAVHDAFALVAAATKRTMIEGQPARFDGALIARMVRGWGELMVGVRRDPIFGLVILVGIGGTMVEVFRQTALGLAPLNRAQALVMLRKCRADALLGGHRGHPVVDLDGVADVMVRIAAVAVALGPRLDTLEINPLIITADGVVAADAVITLYAPD